MTSKLTKAKRRVLETHLSVHPKGVAWTSDLCQYRTWEALYDDGFLYGGRITPAGRAALEGAGR